MNLLTLKSNKGARHRRKRVGRGNGSGMGTYSTRGMNGQNSRSGGNRRPGFEGGQTPFIQRMPKLKGFKNPNAVNYQVVNVGALDVFDDNANVDKEALLAKGIISRKSDPVKLLGDGELTKKLTITVDAATKSADEKVKKAKGSLTVTAKKKEKAAPKKDKKTKEKAATPAKEEATEATEEKAEK
ncbi:50S ribosomal protein L15 [Patescibacteria group bacterium]